MGNLRKYGKSVQVYESTYNIGYGQEVHAQLASQTIKQ